MKQTIFVSPCPGRCLAAGAFFYTHANIKRT